jgi:hypothetical protein
LQLRSFLEPMIVQQPFDENWYLATNPDVAEAVRADLNLSAHSHFIQYGYFEGRAPVSGILNPIPDSVSSGAQLHEVQSGLEGYLDLCTNTRIAGWAWDSLHPERHVTVEIIIDERPLAQIIAREYRKDLKNAGIGDGTYGYCYTPSVSIDPKSQRISVMITEAGMRFPLSDLSPIQTLD